MPATKASLWHYAPFMRLLIPLIAGVIVQWHFPFSFDGLLLTGCLLVCGIIVYFFLPDKRKFQFSSVNGLFVYLVLFIIGAVLTWTKDIRHNEKWIGHFPHKDSYFMVRLLEPLVEKENSFKALAEVKAIASGKQQQKTEGKIIVYFKKDSLLQSLNYGSQILFNKTLQPIKNSGNPGSFNYQQYCLLHGITYQVYLAKNEFAVLPQKNVSTFQSFLFKTRIAVVRILREFIKGYKERGLAEALLIGYKDDLDKNLVQSYSNTGVVHIIAISGLHLGLIYWLLLFLTRPLRKKKQLAWLRFLTIASCLWIFSLLAGGGPSVLRSAVMFSCIAFGEVLNRKSSVYNTLSLSAFILLLWNPFWLWDVGFHLSYAAVLSIVIFFRPIYNWFYIPNKPMDWLWKLNAVTLAAQILTLPISIYHFHQFPVLFLVANFIAVPISSLILIGEIMLVVFSFITPVAKVIGWLLQQAILFMNFFIEQLNELSFAVWNHLSISISQTVLLLAFIAAISYWLMEKNKKAIWPAFACLAAFIFLRSFSFLQANGQKALIVYNVPKHQAIDIVQGRKYLFIGDEELVQDDFIRNFHLQPSRIMHRTRYSASIPQTINNFQFHGKNILVIDSMINFKKHEPRPLVDVAILSKNPKLYLGNLIKSFQIKQVVIDGSVPAWKASLWKKDCDSLDLACHDVTENGAFVMKIQ